MLEKKGLLPSVRPICAEEEKEEEEWSVFGRVTATIIMSQASLSFGEMQ